MSLILLVIGALLVYMGRIDLGTLQASGRHVKAAGAILTLPGIVTLALTYFFIPLSFGSNPAALDFTLGVVAVLDVVGMIVAIGLAYILISDPPNAPRLPGLLGEIQAEARSGQKTDTDQSASPPKPEKKTVIVPAADTFRPKSEINRDKFPSVMSLKQAARYLQVTEDEVMALIDSGKLPAARDNYNYKIAKSQLDELLG
jgi:excisionase family DNA binding protein